MLKTFLEKFFSMVFGSDKIVEVSDSESVEPATEIKKASPAVINEFELKRIDSDQSIFFYGSTEGKVRKNLSKENFIIELNKMFPNQLEKALQSNCLKMAHSLSIFKNDPFDVFLLNFSILTTKQISFFLYSKLANKNDISYAGATPYNKNPIQSDWYSVGSLEVLLYSPGMHLRYVHKYINTYKGF